MEVVFGKTPTLRWNSYLIYLYIIPFEHVFSTATLKLHECQGTKDPEQQKAIAKQKTNAMNSEIAGEPNPFTPWPYQIAGLPAL